jgi:hypothetical protein
MSNNIRVLWKDKTSIVHQYCPVVKDVVVLTVNGSIYCNIINGVVVDCSNNECKNSNKHHSRYCWLNKHVQTALS